MNTLPRRIVPFAVMLVIVLAVSTVPVSLVTAQPVPPRAISQGGSGPLVTSVSPTLGPVAGGTTVTITGTNLIPATGGNPTAILFGGIPASGVSCASATTCTAISPEGSGAVYLTVVITPLSSPTVSGALFSYQTNGAASWTRLCRADAAPLCGIEERFAAAIALDPQGQLVLFGGICPCFDTIADTALWNGSIWTDLCGANGQAACGPDARSDHGLAYHAGSGKTVLYGGNTTAQLPGFSLGDTWLWNGSVWTVFCGVGVQPACAPGKRYDPAMAYDPIRDLVLMFGGTDDDGNSLADTWTSTAAPGRRSAAWACSQPAVPPHARWLTSARTPPPRKCCSSAARATLARVAAPSMTPGPGTAQAGPCSHRRPPRPRAGAGTSPTRPRAATSCSLAAMTT